VNESEYSEILGIMTKIEHQIMSDVERDKILMIKNCLNEFYKKKKGSLESIKDKCQGLYGVIGKEITEIDMKIERLQLEKMTMNSRLRPEVLKLEKKIRELI
jgi:hypothetical protein